MKTLSSNHKVHRSLKTLACCYEALIAISFALLSCSCNGGGSSIGPPPTIAVSLNSAMASLAVGATQHFTATVTGTSNTSVSWSVNGIADGNSTVGTVSSSGLYTAPNKAPSTNPVSVTATSQADSTKSAAAAVTVRNQVLSVAASPAQGISASDALDLVHNAGARGQGVDLHWPNMEPSPGVYDFTKANQINDIQARGPFLIHVTLGVINTNIRQVPPDLALLPFDSAQMKTRFQNMLTAFLTQFGSKIDSIAIGNEVDVYLSANPTEWQAYSNFYGEAAALVHTQQPSIRVGVTTTFGGATGVNSQQTAQNVASLNSVSDLFMMNYYPLHADFTPRDHSVTQVQADFTNMITAAQGKPILLQEVGFPTSTALGSSVQLQAEFVTSVFAVWLNAGDKVEFLSFFLLHDATPQACQQIANEFGQTNPNFVAFFCSLGLRNSDGTDKQGWTTLKTQAQQDGFTAQP